MFLIGDTPQGKVGTSISYEKSGTTYEESKIKYEVRQMDLVDTTLNLINNQGQVDLEGLPAEPGGPGANFNDFFQNFRYFAFDVNPSSYAGTLSFWNNPGGKDDETARGFTFSSTQDPETGTLSGCAYAGANDRMSIRKAARESVTLKVDDCWQPFLSSGVCSAGNKKAWKQCFEQQNDGSYAITTPGAGYEVIDPSAVNIPFVNMDIKKVTKTDD